MAIRGRWFFSYIGGKNCRSISLSRVGRISAPWKWRWSGGVQSSTGFSPRSNALEFSRGHYHRWLWRATRWYGDCQGWLVIHIFSLLTADCWLLTADCWWCSTLSHHHHHIIKNWREEWFLPPALSVTRIYVISTSTERITTSAFASVLVPEMVWSTLAIFPMCIVEVDQLGISFWRHTKRPI